MAIVVIGTIFVDIKGFPDNVYIPTGRNKGRVETIHGGVGRNVVEDIANVELQPRFVSLVEDSDMGRAVISKLNKHKVDTQYVLEDPNGMGIYLAIFDESGDVAGSVSQRPVMLPLAELIEEKGDEIFADADSIVIEIDIDKEVLKPTLQFAKKYNKPVYAVVSNMSIASKRRDLIHDVDCIVCNEQEAELLFVTDFSECTPEEVAEKLPGLVENADMAGVVVTLGSKGAVYANRKGESGYCPAKAVNVADTTGAGDAFFSGVAIGLTYGKPMKEAVEIGTRLASSVIFSSENVCPRVLPSEFGIVF